ncbi:STAS domain-containing protein [Kitasatospora phosalacinea]|uniref:STAS domain-containing protein n=1 Tax=Kitasatospora phosalacinea TaxID=2065 RepID=UPI00068F7E77|nr:STAS domain-containing protein [Kitasatospora phosalacinea]
MRPRARNHASPGSGAGARLVVERHVRPGATGVVVRGAVDTDSAPELHRALRSGLRASRRSLALDLSGVSFCDCACLNVLLELRRRAGSTGRCLTVSGCSPAVLRLLDLTGTLDVLFPPRPARSGPAAPPRPGRVRAGGRAELLRRHRARVGATGRRAVAVGCTTVRVPLGADGAAVVRRPAARTAVERAKGVLAEVSGVSPDVAGAVLSARARRTGRSEAQVAREIVGGLTAVTGSGPPAVAGRRRA